jgi:hypothetical protein
MQLGALRLPRPPDSWYRLHGRPEPGAQPQSIPLAMPHPQATPACGRPLIAGGIDPCTREIIAAESGGNVRASYPSAQRPFGLGQLTYENRVMLGRELGINPDTTDYSEQLRLMEAYISRRYGSPCAALAFRQTHITRNGSHWY